MPRSTPPLLPSPELNLEDLELLHQYVTSSSVATSQLPTATAQMQTTVPQLAQTQPFVMRGLLAQAAVHLSWLRPGRSAHYTSLAAKHHSVGLPAFRTALDHLDESNHLALIIFSKGLVWCSFAWYDSASRAEQTSSTRSRHGDWLPPWFHLLRGSCLVVNACRAWIRRDLHILPPRLVDVGGDGAESGRIAALQRQLKPLVHSPACEPVLSALGEAFNLASMHHHNTPLRNAMNFWMGALPNDYLDELHRSEPWALVVLAHFCILVSRSETRWFMEGHGKALLRSVLQRLGPAWTPYVQWPCKEVGW